MSDPQGLRGILSLRALAKLGINRRRSFSILVGAVVSVLIFFLPDLVQPRWVRVALIIIIWAVLASGLNILAGFCGLLDLGFVAFFAIGAYFSGIVTTRIVVSNDITTVWWVFVVDLIAGGLLAGVAGAVIGYPTLRLRGDYLAIMTLGFGEIIRTTAINWTSVTNGTRGIRGIPNPSVLGLPITSLEGLFYLGVVLAGIGLFVIHRLLRSHVGRAWISIREDQDVAESLGIPTSRYKLYAYIAGAVFAGMMGVFFVHVQRFISPESFSLLENVIILLLVVIGGMGSIWGPLLGATIWFVSLEQLAKLEIVQAHAEVRQMILAAILIAIMVVRPRGLLGEAKTLVTDR